MTTPHPAMEQMTEQMTEQVAEQVAEQQPDWPDPELLAEVQQTLHRRPALVSPEETDRLADRLAEVATREAVVLQGGDCAELFADATATAVRRRLDQLRELGSLIRTEVNTPAVTLGRMAGQYAKPRSATHERSETDELLPVYRGDAVNDVAADARARTPDPLRLLTAYDCAAKTLAAVREHWADHAPAERTHVSHELLLFPYELPLIRDDGPGLSRYSSSAHFGWIGDRTRRPDGRHIALARSVRNPVGVKIGPGAAPGEVAELAALLNPERRPGRLTFIVRMGADRIDRLLPPIVEAVAAGRVPVIWLSDPMHGNTVRHGPRLKTRTVRTIVDEIASFVRILSRQRQWPGGLHLEMTPEPVTECVQAPADLTTADFPRYRSPCDPRLNPEQATEAVTAFSTLLRAL
ncbi:3-deoxy-7-phosphoheptulonate synthase [Streptomyces sp. NPDC052101]|uniref:3-deoxy-7-phosphoheptulonate synthase n=1 Tax=Streptomyces sp. NPDC052101 TaxID=3155763 RepID=UPI0034328628